MKKLYKYHIMYGSGNFEKGLIKSDSEKSAYKTIWSLEHPKDDFETVWYNETYNGWPTIWLEEITKNSFDENGMVFVAD
jgi:hypothetical protein